MRLAAIESHRILFPFVYVIPDISFQIHRSFVHQTPCALVWGANMQAQIERWKQVCEQIAVEQDPTRFTNLVDELNRLLEEKERRLAAQGEPERPPSNTAT